MMQLGSSVIRQRKEAIVPMINVVFLLLIFFLMTAQITPPEPFEIEPPASEAENPAEQQPVLYISPEGELAFQDARGEEALALITDALTDENLLVRADQALKASEVAALLPKLSVLGVKRVQIVSRQE